MTKETRKKGFLLFLLGVLFYALFNYLPFSLWIPNEYGYLSLKISYYVVLSGFLLFFKKKLELEIERPYKQIGWYWLIPLLLPAFSNFLAVFFLDIEGTKEIEGGILAFDLITDFFVSVAEDTIFVDIALGLLLDVLPFKRKKNVVLSLFITAFFFTAIHCYSFIYNDPEIAAFSLVYVFLLTMECGYLAIYFDSAWIPILVHYFFNAIDFVAFEQIYEINEYTPEYLLFCLVMLFFGIFYTLALAKISTEQDLRVLGERKLAEVKADIADMKKDVKDIADKKKESNGDKEALKNSIQQDLAELEKDKEELMKDLQDLEENNEESLDA